MADRVTREQFREVVQQALSQGVRLDEIITEVTDVAFVMYCKARSVQDAVAPHVSLDAFEAGGGTFGGGGASGNW